MYVRNCDECGREYEYQRLGRSRFCSKSCRAKNDGAPKSIDLPEPLRRKGFVNDDPDDPVEVLRERARAKIEGDWAAYDRAMAKWNALPWSARDPHGVRRDNPKNWLK